MLTEIIITVFVAFILVAVAIDTLAIILYIFCKSIDFYVQPHKGKIIEFAGKAFSIVWKVVFFPVIWVFERL
ncbi:MAG: hypothetical protein M0R51_11500 [Clostridia bacterium]|nr:hypothetical protein [Clostridia bacterium]